MLSPSLIAPACSRCAELSPQVDFCRISPSTKLAEVDLNPQTTLLQTCYFFQCGRVYASVPRASSNRHQSSASLRLSNEMKSHAVLLGRNNSAEKRLQALNAGLSYGISFSASGFPFVAISDSRKQLGAVTVMEIPTCPSRTTLQWH